MKYRKHCSTEYTGGA